MRLVIHSTPCMMMTGYKPYNLIKTVERWQGTVKLKKQVMDTHVAVDVCGVWCLVTCTALCVVL